MAMFNNYDRLPDGIHRLCEMFIEEPLNMIEYAYEGLEGSLPNPWSYPGPIAGRAIEQSKKNLESISEYVNHQPIIGWW